MAPTVVYPNVQSAATAVHRWLRQHALAREMVARPWNRFDPVNSLWYLVPSPEWPAFRFGKAFLRTDDGGHTLRCGWNVEKGLEGVGAAQLYPARSCLADHWHWHRLARAMQSGQVGRAAEEVAARSGCRVRLQVTASYSSVPEPDTVLESRPTSNTLWFSVFGQDLSADPVDAELQHLGPLAGCRNLASVPEMLASLEEIAWLWIDVFLGIELEMAPLDPRREPSADAWRAADLWERAVAPWHARLLTS